MKRTKNLYYVRIPDIAFPHDRNSSYVLAFNECHALNLLIKFLHEQDGIPLEHISLTGRSVVKVNQFIK